MGVVAIWINAGQRGAALMLAAAVVLYVASRAAATATAGGRPASAGRMAVGHWMPIATVAAVAALLGQFAVAVGVVFASAVACLSLGIGSLALVNPGAGGVPAGRSARRRWPLLVPAGLLALLAGFHRSVRWTDAAALAVEGAVILLVWTGRPRRTSAVTVPGRVPPLLRPVQLAVATLAAVAGAVLAVQAMSWATAANDRATPGLLTATVLAPLLILPALGTATDWAARGAAPEAASGLVGMALLDACLGLPIVAAFAAARSVLVDTLAARPGLLWGWQGWPAWLDAVPPSSSLATSRPVLDTLAVSPLAPFPVAVWRVDLIALLAISAALVPVGLGRYPVSRGMAAALCLAYAAYLFAALRYGVGGL